LLGGNLEGEGSRGALSGLLGSLIAIETKRARIGFIFESLVGGGVAVGLLHANVARGAVAYDAAGCAELC